MKKLLIAATALSGWLLLSGAASAADPVVEDSVYDWTGFYIGVHGGYGEANVDGDYDTSDGDDDFEDDGSGDFSLDLNGFLGGGQIGFNWQTGSWVWGVEADASFVDWDDDEDNDDPEEVSADTDFLGTLRLRAGWAADNVLLYATAGGVITDTEYQADDNDGSKGSLDLDDIGLAVGGGVDWGFASNWSFRVEGLYFFFDDHDNASSVTDDSDSGDDVELDDGFLVRAGLNLHF